MVPDAGPCIGSLLPSLPTGRRALREAEQMPEDRPGLRLDENGQYRVRHWFPMDVGFVLGLIALGSLILVFAIDLASRA